MRILLFLLPAFFVLILLPGVPAGSEVDGIIKIGYVFIDETAGDLSVIQESYNLYEDFTISQFKLNGKLTPQTYFSLNLSDINLDNQKASFQFKIPGQLKLRATFDQHRQVFDAFRNTVSDRKDTRISANATPVNWLAVSMSYNIQDRTGNRSSHPTGVESNLGERYDYLLQSGRIEGRAHFGPRFIAASFDYSDFSNELSSIADRQGKVVSVRAFSPCFFTDKLMHSLRAAYGIHEVSEPSLDYTFANVQYTGEVRPHEKFKLKYTLFASRIDDDATEMKTDNIKHGFDGEYRYLYGTVFGGYSYETNDDHEILTSFNAYRVGGSVKYKGKISARVKYATRMKDDEEKRTLLQESETQSFRGDLSVKPIEGLTLGGRYFNRNRDLPDIGVEIDGRTFNTFASYAFRDWGSLRADYTYARNEFDDRIGSFNTLNHTVTSRIQIDYIENLTVAGGLAYIDIGKDLDIEKSTLFFESKYTLMDHYHIEVKYDIYNFDDYVLLDRYYTANVVWINVGYSFQVR